MGTYRRYLFELGVIRKTLKEGYKEREAHSKSGF